MFPLQLPLFATAAGMLLAGRGGCLLLAAAWLAVAVALWTAYASPSRIARGVVGATPALWPALRSATVYDVSASAPISGRPGLGLLALALLLPR